MAKKESSKDKKSFGSCRGEYSRRDGSHQYVDISTSEAARLLIALQNVVGNVIANENRRSESGVRLWLHESKDDSVKITVYRNKG